MKHTVAVGPRLALVFVLVLVAAGVPVAPSAAFGPGDSYVSLGDSYTAGPYIHPVDPGSGWCLRSEDNYPRQVADRFQIGDVSDASCIGAQTHDLFAPQTVNGYVNPPQLDRLLPTTSLVTLQIGGNDIGFFEIVNACFTLLPLGTPCQDRYVSAGVDEISQRIEQVGPLVADVLAEIRRRSPAAEIFVIGYPAVLPEASAGCWPFMPYAPGDISYLVAKNQELNSSLMEQAVAAGATFVDTYSPSRGHDACAGWGVRWVEPAVLALGAAPIHPNALGMTGMAAEVAGVIEAARQAGS